MVWLILVGGVWKPPKLTKFSLKFCPQGFGLAAPLKPPCAASPDPWGQDFRPNFVSLGGFQTPPTNMSYTTPHHIPKYEILQKKKNVNHPFNMAS